MYFFGEDGEVVLDGHEREFVEWRWAALEQVPAEVLFLFMLLLFISGVYDLLMPVEFYAIVQRAALEMPNLLSISLCPVKCSLQKNTFRVQSPKFSQPV